MASPAVTLSWNSSSWLNNRTLTRTTNEGTTKITDKASTFVVLAQKKAKKTRKIILIEDVTDVGKKGQLLDVKAGFYRNFLHPTGKARIVTPWRSLKNSTEGSEVTGPKNSIYVFFFYKTGGSKMYIPKKLYTKRTFITLLSEKFGGSGPRPLESCASDSNSVH
ncbi:putative ribosomal protein L9 [Helianthus anomalus]